MEFRLLLKKRDFSKSDTLLLCERIQSEPSLLNGLVECLFEDIELTACNAARVLSNIATKIPKDVQPYIPSLIRKLKDPKNPDAVKRNLVRLLQYVEIPEELDADVLDLCVNFLQGKKVAAAIKAFSMTVAIRVARKYPELCMELRLIIEDLYPMEKASFQARAKKELKVLNKLQKTGE